MRNLWIEHFTEEEWKKNGGHGSTIDLGVDVFAKLDGERVIVASLQVKYNNGYPRVKLCTHRARDVVVET